MTSLIILAVALIVLWLWATWQRSGHAAFMQEWIYVPLVAGVMCLLMALGLWLR